MAVHSMIFLDTGYFVGLFDDNDVHHDDSLKIKEFLEDLNETTVINTTVLIETLNKSVGTCDVLTLLCKNSSASLSRR